MEKFRHFTIGDNGHLIFGGIDSEDLIKEYGTPTYFFDVSYIESVCNAYKNAYIRSEMLGSISYASKALSCKEIYRIMNNQDVFIDVVSGGELFTALSVDFPAEKIFFHGNNKTDEELDFAIKSHVGTIVIDSYEEAEKIQKIAEKYALTQKVMIRINPGVEAHTHHYIQTAKVDSKFGFSISNGEAEKIIKFTLDKRNLFLTGLHCHIGSQIFDKKSFLIAVEKMASFYYDLNKKLNLNLKELNLGGGFGIWYADGDYEFSVSDYTDILTDVLLKIKNEFLSKNLIVPTVYFEPGRSIVGEAGVTIYKVGSVKQIPDVKNYISVDGGMFENPRFALYQAKYTVKNPLKMTEKGIEKFTVAGKCCESGDIIAEDVVLPETKAGDYLCVFSTGAYNYSMASNYNRNPVPPVIFVKDKKSYYAVKKQTYSDIIRNDV